VRAAAFALVLVCGCGAGVQNATITAPTAQPSNASAATQERWVLVRERSRLDVVGVDIVGGKHPVTFDHWEGSVIIGPPNRVTFVVEMATARGKSETITGLLKYELLHVDKHPQATFTGTIDEHGRVDGNATIHGVTRGLQFHGTLAREGAEYHFTARFKISRAAFDIRTEASWDSLIKDDVHLYVDLRARHVEGGPPSKE
jgi:polyisoprenoid-binding protein YceI